MRTQDVQSAAPPFPPLTKRGPGGVDPARQASDARADGGMDLPAPAARPSHRIGLIGLDAAAGL
jgi:hypothetical protein